MLNRIRLTSPIICLLPIVAVVPIIIDIFFNLHSGGLNTLYKFFSSAINPSLNYLVIKNALDGLKITMAIALISSLISVIIGFILGLICSKTFYETFESPQILHKILKKSLAIPRAIHELIWGLVLLQFFGLTPWIAILAIAIPYTSLMARVFADQIDTLNTNELHAIKTSGAGSIEALITAVLPKLLPVIITHSSYRLECALRGATLLGVFGLGGIGTELYLSIQSLQFREVWTSLWILGVVVFLLEMLNKLIQRSINNGNHIKELSMILFIMISLFLVTSVSYIESLDMLSSIRFTPFDLPHKNQIFNALTNIELTTLTVQTINIMLLASGIAIGGPPLILILLPTRFNQKIIGFLWLICRLIPPPLIALLLLLCINPSIYVAALALGIHNMGVMGKILQESIETSSDSVLMAIKAFGGSQRIVWLYGKLSQKSRAYLVYSVYRADVILRETAVVGVVGGVGLGWQLQESLSSFAWAEVLVVVSTFVLLTVLGESISEKLKSYLGNDSLKVKTL